MTSIDNGREKTLNPRTKTDKGKPDEGRPGCVGCEKGNRCEIFISSKNCFI